MNPPFEITTKELRGVLLSLSIPSSRPALLVHAFTYDSPQNLGHTYQLDQGEFVTAPAAGTVTAIRRRPNDFRHTAGLLDREVTWKVTIDHGQGISTIVQGMRTITVQVGTPVSSGQTIGTPLTNEVFLQVLRLGSPFDPASVSKAFRRYDASVPEKIGKVRGGIDLRERESEDVISWTDGNTHYFVDKYCRKDSLLLNIDFNGNGAKTGFAVVGNYGTDFWNVYTPTEFTYTTGTLCFEIVPTDDISSGTISFYKGTLVECLHVGTLSDNVVLSVGTLVECLHRGTLASSASFSVGTLVECLHVGTLSDSIVLSSGTLVECAHVGTISSQISLSNGSIETGDPLVNGAMGFTSCYSGLCSRNIIKYIGGTNYPSFSPVANGANTFTSLFDGTMASIP